MTATPRADVEITVAVGSHVTLIGKLPGTPWRPTGGINIAYSDRLATHFTPTEASNLARALIDLVRQLDAASDERYGPIDRSGLR